MSESKYALGDSLREQALKEKLTALECAGCGLDAWIGDSTAIAALIEHAAYEHGTRQDIVGVKHVGFITGYTLGLRLGAPPVTEHEARWREEQEVNQ